MATFVSYANEYDLYQGERSIGDLPPDQQDEFIRSVFGTDADFRDIVISQKLLKSQAEGLWSIVVLVGTALENDGKISDFTTRSEADIELIIDGITGTSLWLRVEEAFPPFSALPSRTPYDWRELESISMEAFAGLAGEPLHIVKSGLFRNLKSRPLILKPNNDERMPFHVFHKFFNDGKLLLFVDRGLTAVAGASGVVKSNAPLFVYGSLACLLLAAPFWYFFGFPFSVGLLFLAFILFRHSSRALEESVRQSAISSRTAFRWLMSRKIIWVRQK